MHGQAWPAIVSVEAVHACQRLTDINHACRKPPQIKFKLDFGKALGSGYTAKAVRLWLDPFLRETLADLIVWPNRIVVPILPENVTGPLDDLMLRCDNCWLCPLVRAVALALIVCLKKESVPYMVLTHEMYMQLPVRIHVDQELLTSPTRRHCVRLDI